MAIVRASFDVVEDEARKISSGPDAEVFGVDEHGSYRSR
jgi:hypothetical protein